MKIVHNGQGLYAIRRGFWPFYRYFDLDTPGYWWDKKDIFYLSCWSGKDHAEAWYGILNPTKAVVISCENDKEKIRRKNEY